MALQQALAAAAILEECIERLSQSATRIGAGCRSLFPELGPTKKKVLGAEPQVPQVPTRERPANLVPSTKLDWFPLMGHFPGPRNNI